MGVLKQVGKEREGDEEGTVVWLAKLHEVL